MERWLQVFFSNLLDLQLYGLAEESPRSHKCRCSAAAADDLNHDRTFDGQRQLLDELNLFWST